MYCYNIGCSKTFELSENSENSCRYHSETPTFHDGRKGWGCCNKFSRDFSTCLNTPGCKVGFHNPVKPAEKEKPAIDPKYDVPVVVVNPIEKKPVRPSGDEDLISLPVTEAPQLREEIRKKKEMNQSAKESEILDGNSVAIGTHCKNKACKREYSGSDTNKEICLFHQGEAIFHEGMKFWTCCMRKTSDFDSFLAQEGCTSGKHLWVKTLSQADCRSDWFQTGSSVTISLFSKLVLPESVTIKANAVKLSVAFKFECGSGYYEKLYNLFEEIDPSQSQVKISCAKVEVILKKKHFTNWVALEYQGVPPSN